MGLKDVGLLNKEDYNYEKKLAKAYPGAMLAFGSMYNMKAVAFYAYLQDFSDQITSDWSTQQVYGRIDPIYNFGGNKRQISISWLVPARSIQQARENLRRVNKLTSFLYPNYNMGKFSAVLRSAGIQQAPIVGVKFGNLIAKSDGGFARGFLNGLTFSPDNEMGYFLYKYSSYPKLIKLQTQFTVIHDEAPFWHLGDFQETEDWPRPLESTSGLSEGVKPNEFTDRLQGTTAEEQVSLDVQNDALGSNPVDGADITPPVEAVEAQPELPEETADDEQLFSADPLLDFSPAVTPTDDT